MASTYVNDLRLNEMATGDASGSWGTVTNTNLELIGEAFSYGTETIGDADSTLTIADGAADAARSFYLKITSSVDLTTTRIVTLAPNTVSKVWMIENATTGSQVITIKQGSGATINVPNGQVKMISTDGAGSGGAVLDLLVDVDLTGTTTLVNLNVSGAVDIAGDLTLSAGGDGALRFTAASSVKVLDNNAAALVFEEADNAYMTFVTTDGSEAVKFDKALDINAATQIDATVTVGVDDTGYDVKFFGATAGAYMLWDESADDLILGGAAGLSVNSTALVTGVLTTTAATVHTGGITMPDNAKAIFGAGSDLEIYHDGSNSFINDTGTGSLAIITNGANVNIQKSPYEPMIVANTDGAVDLYHDGSIKLATTATGIDVTGAVAAAAGTALLPSITTTGDLNTGMWFPAADTIAFSEGGVEALRIDSSGKVLVGKASSDFGTAGIEIDGANYRAWITRSGAEPLALNRLTNDGNLIEFAKDGTTVGSIGALGSTTYFSGVNSGLRMDTTIVVPTNASGTNLDASLDLGAAGVRFKDLYLSGGVYLGGTGSANHLDDYEEGTWTPSDGTAAGLTITVNHASYTKIGRVVHVKAYILIPTTTSGTNIILNGLPFTNFDGEGWCTALLTTNNTSLTATRFIRARAGESTLDVGTSEGDVSSTWSDYSNKWMIFSLTYTTT
jgi:hypothetical protein